MRETCAKIYATLSNILPSIDEILNTHNESLTYIGHLTLGVKKIDSIGLLPIFIITHYTIRDGGIEGETSKTLYIDAEHKIAHAIPELIRGTHGDYKIDIHRKPRTEKETLEHHISLLAWLEQLNTSNCP